MTDAALKYDGEKPRMDLLSPDALTEIAKVLGVGARKYSDNNWRNGFNWSRLYGAAMRHLLAHMNGEDKDPESGLSHLAHLGCCVMFLIEHETRGLGTDDRYKHTPKDTTYRVRYLVVNADTCQVVWTARDAAEANKQADYFEEAVGTKYVVQKHMVPE